MGDENNQPDGNKFRNDASVDPASKTKFMKASAEIISICQCKDDIVLVNS